MTYEQIKYEVKDGILTVTLNRPDKLNAFTGKMLSELLDAMDRADRDDDVRAVVFTGAGRGFCAGADAPDFWSQLVRPSTLLGLALYGSAAFLYIIALRKIPVSVAFPSVSLSYAIVAVLGHFLFGEPFGIKQIGGIALIMGGVVLINQS